MDKLLRNHRHDEACKTYYTRKFRRRHKIFLAKYIKGEVR